MQNVAEAQETPSMMLSAPAPQSPLGSGVGGMSHVDPGPEPEKAPPASAGPGSDDAVAAPENPVQTAMSVAIETRQVAVGFNEGRNSCLLRMLSAPPAVAPLSRT